MKDLADYRKEMDQIDNDLVTLFAQRMELSAKIAEYKDQRQLPIPDRKREREKLLALESLVPDNLFTPVDVLYDLIFSLSRSTQRQIMNKSTGLQDAIIQALDKNDKIFPERAVVACQGVEGAFSQMACEKIFSHPNIMYFSSFKGVFAAIDQGLCRYGVLPLENSTAGSVNKIYDLMMDYNFKIVRSMRVKVDHCLLACSGASLDGIKEIISHDHALAQCQEFIKSLGAVKITSCKNTAEAARLVKESGRTDIAALSSRSCAELYGLDCLKSSVQDQMCNYTRFICIAKELEIYPGADKTSLMMVLSHQPGALYKVLSCFYALGINLIKLESRPLPNSDFEFMFYFDLEISVYSEAFRRVFVDLEGLYTSLKYLGSYSEVL